MMKQYHRFKEAYADHILLFRMGDFYEMFYEDARTASRVLGLALTTRNKKDQNPIPLAGIPHHALDSYLSRLIKAGFRVAICDQVEDPAKSKGLVERDVTEIVTPGSISSQTVLDEKAPNYLVSVYPSESSWGVAFLDFSTGEFTVQETNQDGVLSLLNRHGVSEAVVPAGLVESLERFSGSTNVMVTPHEDWAFDYDSAKKTLREHFRVANLDAYDLEEHPAALCAAGGGLSYLTSLKRMELGHFTSIRLEPPGGYLHLDSTTVSNLELVRPAPGAPESATLLHVIDRTSTPMGARLLANWILKPPAVREEIEKRLDTVETLYEDGRLRRDLETLLSDFTDIERKVGRFSCGKGSSRELIALKSSLRLVPKLKRLIGERDNGLLPEIHNALNESPELVELIEASISEDAPASLSDGGTIRKGFSKELDELRDLAHGGKNWIAQFQQRERAETGIPNLKVAYNKVFGYFIEVTKANSNKVPDEYQRKQTLVNAERYTTEELRRKEEQILSAEEKSLALEKDIFESILQQVGERVSELQITSQAVSRLDVLTSLASVARLYSYRRPSISDEPVIKIRDGRHPVVERLLGGTSFVPNDTELDARSDQILIITGPNMGGKSTYLRQVALMVVLAQMGSFVPAADAEIGLVDRIFTRVGASDSLAEGRSTFLNEMTEAARILSSATRGSLVVLDEIGRGTSTFDGLSLAWAISEHLHNSEAIQARTLFATHYHELTDLEMTLPRVRNYHFSAKEIGDEVVFLRRLKRGGSDRSYGIQVARLAGIPSPVIARAQEVLKNLEEGELTPDRKPRLARHSRPDESSKDQLRLFEHRTSAENGES
jgi:DNA mismatch repair protein MutS